MKLLKMYRTILVLFLCFTEKLLSQDIGDDYLDVFGDKNQTDIIPETTRRPTKQSRKLSFDQSTTEKIVVANVPVLNEVTNEEFKKV